jgi:putative oxidoreductase
MLDNIKPAASLTGRILLSLIFLLAGLMKIMDWNGTAAYMASKGMPAIPFFLTIAILFELGAGTCLLFGVQARSAALALVFFLIPATLVFHNFWSVTGPEQQNQMQHFLKNLAIMGGLATVVAHGAGALSIDALLARLNARGWMLRHGPQPLAQ